jgi:hypothetical protein
MFNDCKRILDSFQLCIFLHIIYMLSLTIHISGRYDPVQGFWNIIALQQGIMEPGRLSRVLTFPTGRIVESQSDKQCPPLSELYLPFQSRTRNSNPTPLVGTPVTPRGCNAQCSTPVRNYLSSILIDNHPAVSEDHHCRICVPPTPNLNQATKA